MDGTPHGLAVAHVFEDLDQVGLVGGGGCLLDGVVESDSGGEEDDSWGQWGWKSEP